jgi:hypothetical protein
MARSSLKIAVAVALLVSLGVWAASERAVNVQLGGTLNEPIINYSKTSFGFSRNTQGYGDLPTTCPNSDITSDTPAGALQWTTDAGWVQCGASGWKPLVLKAQLYMDGGVQTFPLPGVLSDGGFSNVGSTCLCSSESKAQPPGSCTIIERNLTLDAGSGFVNVVCF